MPEMNQTSRLQDFSKLLLRSATCDSDSYEELLKNMKKNDIMTSALIN